MHVDTLSQLKTPEVLPPQVVAEMTVDGLTTGTVKMLTPEVRGVRAGVYDARLEQPNRNRVIYPLETG